MNLTSTDYKPTNNNINGGKAQAWCLLIHADASLSLNNINHSSRSYRALPPVRKSTRHVPVLTGVLVVETPPALLYLVSPNCTRRRGMRVTIGRTVVRITWEYRGVTTHVMSHNA